MRRFSAEYLEQSRSSLWQEEHEVLTALSLGDRDRIVEVGAGTGEFTAVLAAQSNADLYALDIDRDHLTQTADHAEVILGDAMRLPVATDTADLVVCQTLLTNLPTPTVAIEEFRRTSRDLVGAIEPDNTAVTVSSTVSEEPAIAKRVRDAYLAGSVVDPTIGNRLRELFDESGLTVRSHRSHEYTRTIEPPYTERALAIAKEQVTGGMIESNREILLAGGITESEYDALRETARSVGREIVAQMQAGEYHREETVRLYITVGAVESSDIEE